MLDDVMEELGDWMHDLLAGMVVQNLTTVYDYANQKVGTIAGNVSKSPQDWNAGIYSLIKNLSESVMMPVAGVIITYVLCYELISLLMDKNNLHEVDTWMFFKYFLKTWIAVMVVSHTMDLTMAIFEIGRRVVQSAGGVIESSAALDTDQLVATLERKMAEMDPGELAMLTVETVIVSVGMRIMTMLITIILYVRMVQIYLYISVAPVPFATLTNREWGQIGTNYLRGLFALAFQGFFIMVCVGVYSILVARIHLAKNIHTALFELASYMVILVFSLLRTEQLSRSVFSAH